MNDKVFELYLEATSKLNDEEKKIFKTGFALGKSEGIAYSTEKLKGMYKK